MKTRGRVVDRFPLTSFFLLSYVFFWLALGLFGLLVFGVFHADLVSHPELQYVVQIVGSWMPSVAMAIVVGMTSGRRSVVAQFRKLVAVPVAGRVVLVALVPVAVIFLAVAGYRLTGGAASAGVALTGGFWITWLILNIVTGATGEEPGWRGFALPILRERFRPVTAGLVLGVIWSWWHLPLWILSGHTGLDMLWYVIEFNVAIVSLSVLMVWLYLRAPHTLIPISLAHFGLNAALQLAGNSGLGLASDLPLLGWVAAGLLSATVILWVTAPTPVPDDAPDRALPIHA